MNQGVCNMKNYCRFVLSLMMVLAGLILINAEFVSAVSFDHIIPTGLPLSESSSVAVDPLTGNIYVTTVCQILVFNSNGLFLKKIGACGTDPGQLFRPTGMIFRFPNSILVA